MKTNWDTITEKKKEELSVMKKLFIKVKAFTKENKKHLTWASISTAAMLMVVLWSQNWSLEWNFSANTLFPWIENTEEIWTWEIINDEAIEIDIIDENIDNSEDTMWEESLLIDELFSDLEEENIDENTENQNDNSQTIDDLFLDLENDETEVVPEDNESEIIIENENIQIENNTNNQPETVNNNTFTGTSLLDFQEEKVDTQIETSFNFKENIHKVDLNILNNAEIINEEIIANNNWPIVVVKKSTPNEQLHWSAWNNSENTLSETWPAETLLFSLLLAWFISFLIRRKRV